mmetsp:Transcript_26403/g.75308  ORF Transcript_26403/g.75308 Transcript_26403/m.75308 type:complete len:445 (+) Transcript_26403:283-1617(+)
MAGTLNAYRADVDHFGDPPRRVQPDAAAPLELEGRGRLRGQLDVVSARSRNRKLLRGVPADPAPDEGAACALDPPLAGGRRGPRRLRPPRRWPLQEGRTPAALRSRAQRPRGLPVRRGLQGRVVPVRAHRLVGSPREVRPARDGGERHASPLSQHRVLRLVRTGSRAVRPELDANGHADRLPLLLQLPPAGVLASADLLVLQQQRPVVHEAEVRQSEDQGPLHVKRLEEPVDVAAVAAPAARDDELSAGQLPLALAVHGEEGVPHAPELLVTPPPKRRERLVRLDVQLVQGDEPAEVLVQREPSARHVAAELYPLGRDLEFLPAARRRAVPVQQLAPCLEHVAVPPPHGILEPVRVLPVGVRGDPRRRPPDVPPREVLVLQVLPVLHVQHRRELGSAAEAPQLALAAKLVETYLVVPRRVHLFEHGERIPLAPNLLLPGEEQRQ